MQVVLHNKVFRAAIQADPEVNGGFFTGPDKRKFLPTKKGRVYVKRKGVGTVFLGKRLDEDQQKALLFEGRHPAGYEVIYIDDNGHSLTEPPPLLTLENILETTPSSLPKNAIIEAERYTKNTSQTEGKTMCRSLTYLWIASPIICLRQPIYFTRRSKK